VRLAVSARPDWVIFDDLGLGTALPVNPNDRKYRARFRCFGLGPSSYDAALRFLTPRNASTTAMMAPRAPAAKTDG
jgi:hypothetical protein